MINAIVRDTLRKNGVYQWQLASSIGVSEVKLSRMLKNELPIGKQFELVGKIQEIVKERDQDE